MVREIACTEVWGGTGTSDVSVMLAGVRGECYARPFQDAESGGDIHFLSVCGMSILSKIVIADVSGHGVESAEVSTIIHDALIDNIGAHDNHSMLRQVNEAFLARRDRDVFRFTTMVSLILDSRDRSLVYAYAGHPAILHGRRGEFRPIEPEERTGLPLGVLPGTEYCQHFVQLEAGDVLAVYSDAFSEAWLDGEMIGTEGLARLLEGAQTMAPAGIKEHVLQTLGELNDDATIVVLEVL